MPGIFWHGQIAALNLTQRSVSLSTATASAAASETFTMTVASTTAIGSVVFEYCTNSPIQGYICTPPSGFDVTTAALAAQSGNVGFSVDAGDSTANRLVITRPAVAGLTVASSYQFDSITNPPTVNQTTYVRISTYTSTNGSGSPIDQGSVAFSTSANFAVGAYVPPFLKECVGVTVALDCSIANGDTVDLGNLSLTATPSGTSQLAASTNDPGGLSIYVLGTTMTSGNNELPAVVNQPARPGGVAQFGLNLRQNSNPASGSDPAGVGTVTPSAGYGTPDVFSFVPGSQLANSPIATDYTRLTVSYIANIAANQPVGVYATTLTYLASAAF